MTENTKEHTLVVRQRPKTPRRATGTFLAKAAKTGDRKQHVSCHHAHRTSGDPRPILYAVVQSSSAATIYRGRQHHIIPLIELRRLLSPHTTCQKPVRTHDEPVTPPVVPLGVIEAAAETRNMFAYETNKRWKLLLKTEKIGYSVLTN
jgi:hypothetical protein